MFFVARVAPEGLAEMPVGGVEKAEHPFRIGGSGCGGGL